MVPYRWWNIYTIITSFSMLLLFIGCLAFAEWIDGHEPKEISIKSQLKHCEYTGSVKRDGRKLSYYKCKSGNSYLVDIE